MRVKRDIEAIEIMFNALEGEFLGQILDRIAKVYRATPEQLSGPAADLLYTGAGCASGTTPEEIKDWQEQLHGLKLGRLTLIEKWIAQLSGTDTLRNRMTLSLGDAGDFVGTINDHRLLAAAEHGIGEEEMTLRDPAEVAAMPPERQSALMEIHFLAWLMEEVLQAMDPA